MPTRSTDEGFSWSSLLRLKLSDIAILVSLVMWLVSGRADTIEAKEKIKSLQNEKQDKVAAQADRDLILERLKDLKSDMQDVKARLQTHEK